MLHLLIAMASPQFRKQALLGLAACLLGVWLLIGDYDQFTMYRNYGYMTSRQNSLGYAFAGRFGKLDWPAIVVGRTDGDKGVTVTLPNGQKHIYSGFSGHMKVLTLRSGFNNVFVLVYSEKPNKTSIQSKPLHRR